MVERPARHRRARFRFIRCSAILRIKLSRRRSADRRHSIVRLRRIRCWLLRSDRRGTAPSVFAIGNCRDLRPRAGTPLGSKRWSCVAGHLLPSISPSVHCVSTIVRRTPASVSDNVRRKRRPIVRRTVHHYTPIQSPIDPLMPAASARRRTMRQTSDWAIGLSDRTVRRDRATCGTESPCDLRRCRRRRYRHATFRRVNRRRLRQSVGAFIFGRIGETPTRTATQSLDTWRRLARYSS
jgi:hypothetical protein